MVNKIDLLSNDEFTDLVNESSSISEILTKLGYSVNGNSWGVRIIKERMLKLGLSIVKKNNNYGGNNQALSLQKVLTKDSSYSRTKLKDRLVREGLKLYKCECCGISEWNGRRISLQLHHINGINNDNRISNLKLLCPNCHSQTENYGKTKGKGTAILRKADLLPEKDKQLIIETVRSVGIVAARKQLPYRNSLINSVVKNFKDRVVMVSQEGSEIEFSTTMAAAKYLFEVEHFGKSVESNRAGISKCIGGNQKYVAGKYRFYRRSAEV